LSLAVGLTSEHEVLAELYDIDELIDSQAIEHLLGDTHATRRGNSAWPRVDVQGVITLELV
jgi:hypothetical protein